MRRRAWLCLALCLAGAAADEHAGGLRDCIKQVLSSFKAIDNKEILICSPDETNKS